MKLEYINGHPRDAFMELREEDHTYLFKGVDAGYTSATTFIETFFKHFDAKEIINKNYDNWQRKNHKEYAGKSKEEIEEMWKVINKMACDKGNYIHNTIEDIYNGIEGDLSRFEKEFAMFGKFYQEHQHLKPFRTEWIIYHEELKISGSIDMMFKDGDKYVMADWKTNKDIKYKNFFQRAKMPISHLDDCNYAHYCLQQNLYRMILKGKYGVTVDEIFLIWINEKNETYVKIPIPIMEREILNMFNQRVKELYAK